MDIAFGLLDVRLLLALGALVALFFGYRYVSNNVRVRVPSSLTNRDALLDRLLGPRYAQWKIDRQVARLRASANFLGAGKLLEEAGRPLAAAEAYLEGQEHWAAAATFEKLGRNEKAAELYLQAGDYKKGATLLTAAGRPARAAALFLEKGNTLEAARLFAIAGQWATAAELYDKGGYPLRAAEAWEKAGDPLKAAERFEKHFAENAFTGGYSGGSSADQQAARHAGDLFRKSGQLARAAAVYAKGGYHRQAGEVLLELRDPLHAAEMFMKAEDHERAAHAYEQAGDGPKAAALRGEVAFKADRLAEAATWFAKAGDFLRSAELFEAAGRSLDAAGAYEQGESWAAAGSVYARIGEKAKAAAALEKAGDLETAASLYEELGDLRRAGEVFGRAGLAFRSGAIAARAGDRSQAIAMLQRVGASDENIHAADVMLGRLFIETNRPALAIERVRRALQREPSGAERIELTYWLARAHEASGNWNDALALYEQVQAEDVAFLDATDRLDKLRRGIPQAAAAARPAAPSPAAPAAPPPTPSQTLPPAAPPPPAPARARFQAREEIARGPLGVVRRGEDTVDGRGVVLRLIPPSLFGDLPVRAVADDVVAASQVSHPNLAKVIAWIECEGQPCVVSEHVPGRNFAEAIASGRRLSVKQVHALGRNVAQVLALLHARGLVHGSVQPSNVMVASGVIKLTDLGLGQLAWARRHSPSYHAPEARRSAADDVYGLCALMYHLMTGTHPASHPQGVGLPLPSQLAADVPEAMDKLLARGLHPRPELRHSGAEDLLGDLRQMVTLR